MTHLSFDRWEQILRESHTVIRSRKTARMLEVLIRRTDGSVLSVEVDQRVLRSLSIADSDIEELLYEKLDTSLLRDERSSKLQLGVVEGWVGFYDPSQHYGVVQDDTPGTFFWTANPPGK